MSDLKKCMSQGLSVTGIVAGGNGIYTIGVGGRVTKKKSRRRVEKVSAVGSNRVYVGRSACRVSQRLYLIEPCSN